MDIEKPEQFKTLPLQISRESTLQNESIQPVLISTEQNVASISKVEIIPQKPLPVHDITTPIESEVGSLVKKKSIKSQAVEVSDIVQQKSISIFEADVKESTEILKTSAAPQSEIKSSISKSQEHLIVGTTEVHEELSQFKEEEKKIVKASISIKPLEAQSMEEVISMISEQELIPEVKAPKGEGQIKYTPIEAIEVSQIIENEEVEKCEDKIKLHGVSVEPEICLSENIEISEIIPEDRPDKYYPELIVPTESAIEKIIENKSCVVEETTFVEKEGKDIYENLPTKVVANVLLSENNPLEVIQSTSADKEHELKPRKRPDTFTASQEFGLHESVVTQQADYQSPLEDRDFLKLNEEKATMKIIEKQSISLESTAVQEPINELNLPEIQSKKGTQTYLTYESSEVTENIIHETSENLKTFKPHNEEIAGIKLSTAQQAPNLQQVTLFETSTDIISDEIRDKAKVSQEAHFLNAGEKFETTPAEKEKIISYTKPTELTIEPSIDEKHETFVVEQKEIFESENTFAEQEKPLEHKAQLKSIIQNVSAPIIDEANVLHSTGNIDNLKISKELASTDYEINVIHSTEEQTILHGTKNFNVDEVSAQKATPEFFSQAAIEISEQCIIESESTIEPSKPKISQAIAKSDDRPMKSLFVEEITSNIDVSELDELKEKCFTIDISLSEHISKAVAEQVLLEEADTLFSEVKPSEHTASTDFNINQTVEQQQYMFHEKEGLLSAQEPVPLQEVKIIETPLLHSSIIQGIQSLESVDQFKDQATLSKKAAVEYMQHQSLASSDITSLETISNLKLKTSAPEENVVIDIITNKPLEVSLVSSSEKEEHFCGIPHHQKTKASIALGDSQKAIEVSEVLPSIQTGDFMVSQKDLENIKPSGMNFKEISVDQIHVWEKESDIKEVKSFKDTATISNESNNLKAPLVHSVEDNICLSDVSLSTHELAQVKVVQEAARETITSSIMILDSTSEFVKSEKESTNTEFTITEGPLLATEFSQTVIDQTEDFDSEVPKIIKAENLLPEGNITTITNIIQTEENVGPLQSFEVDTKTTSISCTEGMGVALSSTEITFDESNDFITQEPNKISLKSRSIEVCKAPVQEQQMKLESECVLEKLEISLRQPRLSLSSVEKSVPLVSHELHSEKEDSFERMKLETSIADIRPGDGILAAVIEEVLVESTIEGEIKVFDSTTRKANLKQDTITPLLTEEQISFQDVSETYKLESRKNSATISIKPEEFKNIQQVTVFENTEDYKTFKLIESRPSISEIQKTHLRGPVTEEVLAFESSVDLRKIGPEEPTKLSPVVDSSLVAPSKSEISPIESTGTYDSKNIIQFKTTTLLEPALSASNTTVLFEEFKEGNLQLESPKQITAQPNTECHKSINTQETYLFESGTENLNNLNITTNQAKSCKHESIPLLTETIEPLENYENLEDSLIAVKPKELIEGDVKLYSHEQKVTIIQSGK